MRFSEFLGDEATLEEFGRRMERLRLERNLTQVELAERAGVSRSTVERLERGASTQLTNLIRCLRALGALDRLEALLPETGAGPMELLEGRGKARRRVRHSRTERPPGSWTWGEG